MQPPYNIVIADTTCFILLNKIDEMQLLKSVFSKVFTTSVIAIEFKQQLPSWIEIKNPVNNNYQQLLEFGIDKGESSAIALAVEFAPALLILDDLKARKMAAKLDLHYTGTLGILLKCKEQNIVPAVKPLLDKIQQTNFRLSAKLFNEILQYAGEL